MRQQAKTPLFKGGIKRRLGFEPSMGEKASAVSGAHTMTTIIKAVAIIKKGAPRWSR